MKTIKYNGEDYLVKELEDWKGDFDDYVKPGEYVAEEIVDYFRDVLPPQNYGNGYLQCGEPVNHQPDANGKYRATYVTFSDRAPGIWIYCGHCFSGEEKHRG